MRTLFIKYVQNQVLLISFILIAILSNQTKAHSQDVNKNEVLLNIKIDSIISILTLEEKIAMCHAQSKFSSPGVPRLGIPELWMSDGPHGIRPEMNWDNWDYANWTNDYVTAFPALTCLAATFNPDLSNEYGVSLGEEARYRKKDVLLGPGVNIYRTPLNGRNFEYLGEDPFLASEMVVPYIHGVQQNGVAACVKHYALNNQEQWRGHINVEVSDRALHEIYLPAFKAAIIEGQSWSIMGAYNKFRGEHCCHNQILLNDILKNKWAFDGVVVSDWAGTHDTNQAIHNGLDIEMGTPSNKNISKRYPYNNNFLGLSANPVYEVSGNTITNTSQAYLPFSHAVHFNTSAEAGTNEFGVPYYAQAERVTPESPYAYSDVLYSALNTFPIKIGFGTGDDYLIGAKTCGSYLFMMPQSYAAISVDGSNARSSKRTVSAGSAASITVPVVFQFRTTDKIGEIGGWSTGQKLTNITYTKIIGLDIYTKSGLFEFDIQVSGKHQRDTIITSPTIFTPHGGSGGGGVYISDLTDILRSSAFNLSLNSSLSAFG